MDADDVILNLKDIYYNRIKPIEKTFLCSKFNSTFPTLTEAEIESVPQILLLGQYSTGKTTFIRNLLGQDYAGMHIGPEPTTDHFIAITHGDREQMIKGNAASSLSHLPFSGLSKFGQPFLNKFSVAVTESPAARNLHFIDTPGVLSGDKQRVARGYDFSGVCRWFGERADLILLFFDAHKLDISDEFKEVIDTLSDHHEKVMCVLNKAHLLSQNNLLRVYGALLWSMGKILVSPEVTRVFVISITEESNGLNKSHQESRGGGGGRKKRALEQGKQEEQDQQEEQEGKGGEEEEESAISATHSPAYLSLFARDTTELISQIFNAYNYSPLNKVNTLIKRTKLLKSHVALLTHLKSASKPFLYPLSPLQLLPSYLKSSSRYQLSLLPQHIDSLCKEYDLKEGDFGKQETLQKQLKHFRSFLVFPSSNYRELEEIDTILQVDLPALLTSIIVDGGEDETHEVVIDDQFYGQKEQNEKRDEKKRRREEKQKAKKQKGKKQASEREGSSEKEEGDGENEDRDGEGGDEKSDFLASVKTQEVLQLVLFTVLFIVFILLLLVVFLPHSELAKQVRQWLPSAAQQPIRDL